MAEVYTKDFLTFVTRCALHRQVSKICELYSETLDE